MNTTLNISLALLISASSLTIASTEEFLGELSANPYAPDSTANPYGEYGSPYSPTSARNPYATEAPALVSP
jgi:hypothetical protein